MVKNLARAQRNAERFLIKQLKHKNMRNLQKCVQQKAKTQKKVAGNAKGLLIEQPNAKGLLIEEPKVQ